MPDRISRQFLVTCRAVCTFVSSPAAYAVGLRADSAAMAQAGAVTAGGNGRGEAGRGGLAGPVRDRRPRRPADKRRREAREAKRQTDAVTCSEV